MSKLVYSIADQYLYYERDNGDVVSIECHNEFEEGTNEYGEPREALPIGEYVAHADEPPTSYNGPAYGTFYINTGDPRGRDIHGGGSSLPDPLAPRQGFLCTYGCLRAQNEDGEKLSLLIIEDGNDVPMIVQEESYTKQ